MTISITSPTSTTSKIQQNGSDVLTVDSSNNVTVTNNLSVSGTVSSTGAITFDGGVSGDVNFDSGTLYVDSTNNRVGIGTSSPSTALDINGYVSFSSGANRRIMYRSANNDILYEFDSGDFYLQDIANSSHKWYTGNVKRMQVGSSGNISWASEGSAGFQYNVDTDPGRPYFKNWVNSTATKNQFTFNNPNGEVGRITTASSSTSYLTSSDYRLKENNVLINDGITRVKLLKPYRFNFITDADNTVDGFFAHEVQDVVPEAIAGTKDEVDSEGNPVYQGIDQAKLVPLLTAALQEAITKIEDLETRIQALENPS